MAREGADCRRRRRHADGSEEVLGPETRNLIALLDKTGKEVDTWEERGGIHAWPVASLYLGETKEARLSGLKSVVGAIKERIHQ